MFHNKKLIVTLLLLSCAHVFAQSQDDETIVNPTTTTVVSTTTTTTTNTPTPSTPKPSTSSTTTTTPVPSTTKAAVPPTTTAAPITTVNPIPSTTPKPTPFPEPEVGKWNGSCIMLEMAAQLNVTYETKDNKPAFVLYNLPKNATYDHDNCDNKNTQSIQINWGAATEQNMLVLSFDKKNDTSILTKIYFNIVADHFPNAKPNQTLQLVHFGKDFGVPLYMSYHCTRPQKLNFTETLADEKLVGTATLSHVQMEAFRSDKSGHNFSIAHDCDSMEPSDIVPIAVGIALVALIAIVLIAYLVARSRSTTRGYMSF